MKRNKQSLVSRFLNSKLLTVYLITILLVIFGAKMLIPKPIQAENETKPLWEITSVDTMKYSRDGARDPAVEKLIPIQVKAAADLGARYVAIDTPYDDEFIPRMTLWVKAARENNLNVWFRGNFSGWEGWFEYPKLTSADEHIKKTYRFITQNPDLFQDGDIYTPAPEAEAGLLGDPRQTRKFDEFNKFLVDSYNNCNQAFGQINKRVNCGIWSLNTDVIRETVTKDTIQKLGGVISIDHYTSTPEKLISDVKAMQKMFGVKVVLGEFGAPIPDLNGNLTEIQQGQYIDKLMTQIYQNKNLFYGMNYWVLNGGSTMLINGDNTPRPAYLAIQKYYQPITISGIILDDFNQAIAGVKVETDDKLTQTTTDKDGTYSLSIPAKNNSLNFSRDDLVGIKRDIIDSTNKNQQIQLLMEPKNKDLWYNAKLWLYHKLNFKL